MQKRKTGLVLQGGGALGAYEYGAVTRLVELGWQPVAVTGVSMGAITAAAIAGARDGDITGSLRQLWEAITLPRVPFLPPDPQAVLLGNPHFWRPRTDFLRLSHWTGLADPSPLLKTLAEICDFKQLNDTAHMRLSVTATNVRTGSQVTFSNGPAKALSLKSRLVPATLGPQHILASGSLPPGFPPTEIDGVPYWDGGLFDNTPIEALLDLLDEDELDQLPIFVVDLFPTDAPVPQNLPEVQTRMLEISYENRFWAQYGGGDLAAFARMVEALDAALPQDSPVRLEEPFQRLRRLRALKHLRIIEAEPVLLTGALDFSPWAIRHRFAKGYAAVDKFLAVPQEQPARRRASA